MLLLQSGPAGLTRSAVLDTLVGPFGGASDPFRTLLAYLDGGGRAATVETETESVALLDVQDEHVQGLEGFKKHEGKRVAMLSLTARSAASSNANCCSTEVLSMIA